MQSNDKSSKTNRSSAAQQTLWQHPYVDVFKHFKILPVADWKSNKKHGDVQDVFAKEIGRKTMLLSGSISANNFIQIPHPNSLLSSLNLTGRYIYLQVKSLNSGTPFTMHFDFGVAERAHNLRISISNLFKNFSTQNGFVVQVPLELRTDRWTVVCVDLLEILKKSLLFPTHYSLEGSHSLKSMTLCANIQIRGVYTSDNEYDYITLPCDMKYKFAFDLSKWLEYFDWYNLPQDYDTKSNTQKSIHQATTAKSQKGQLEESKQRELERMKMSQEIDLLINRQKHNTNETEEEEVKSHKKSRIGKLPEFSKEIFNDNVEVMIQQDQRATGYLIKDKKNERKQVMTLQGLQSNKSDYVSGSYIGVDLKRSAKLNIDPILELKHIIGYSPDRCANLKWSKFPGDNVVIFTSGGTLIAMDVENNNQKRFFFGHSAPICCFDINGNGALIASAQEGKNSIIRIWEYNTGRCISMMTMPVNTLKCLAFSHDGKYLASVGKDSHNKELVIVWDITSISQGQKPEIIAKQTSDFNILCLKFSPTDSSKMASCGKENIRSWRITNNGSIRGKAIVLNHHARNTIFTSLDFEYSIRAVDPTEKEAYQRLFVASKHGMVFQINYHDEKLEGTYQTNDSAIHSIAVSEAFCVTGSEDTYLRVWPLDFSEFFMEAKHEGTVCSVDISPDGLKVVCGTLYGSIGILDKSNQRYRTLLRSHTDQIIQMDYHLVKKNILTVSRDKTIRLWDVDTFDQVYEFSSPIDQPLSIAAHPFLPLFSCGFESGVMRVFDIERTCVADEFSQFNKPLTKLSYSPYGDLLVSCCIDGGVAIHNPKRQHLPIKMMHLEFPPEFAHVAFTLPNKHQDFISDENSDPNNQNPTGCSSKFAVMGEYGNNVNVYDSQSFFIKHQIQANCLLRQFLFGNNNRDIILMTTDCRLRVYSLAKYEGIFLREITTVHRGNITSLSISNNGGYYITGGEDCMVKVWDYEAHKTVPYFFQSFIGHTYPVKSIMFCPTDNGTIITAGEKDGIYLWNFYGDTQTQFAHQTIQEKSYTKEPIQQQQTLTTSKSQSILERMRNTKKEAKLSSQQTRDDTFILPQFKPLNPLDLAQVDLEQSQETSNEYLKLRKDRQLTYNHYANAGKDYDVELQPQLLMEDESEKTIMPTVVNGYDGFGGVHDNLAWNFEEGWMVYTLHNKVIFEDQKTRCQKVLVDSTTQLSTLVLSNDKRYLAVAEGKPNKLGNSLIYLYDTQKKQLIQKYNFHQRGVQALAFSNNNQYLISIGVQGENNLAVWDLQSGLVIRSCLIKNTNAVNQIRVDPYIEDDHIQFTIVGNNGLFNIYRYEISSQQLQTYEVDNIPQEFQQTDFTSLTYTQFFGAPHNTYLIVLGASDGSMTAYDQKINQFVDDGVKKWCISGEIGHIKSNNHSIIIASSTGSIAKYSTQMGYVFPQDSKQVQMLKINSPIVALSMDDLNNEGILGTAEGSIYYLNFSEKLIIKIVSKAYHIQKEITQVKFSEQNPQLFFTNCSDMGSTVKIWTSSSVDQVIKFNSSTQSPVAFILSSTNKGRFSVIGHQSGLIRLLQIESLKVEAEYQIKFDNKDEIFTCAVFNANGINLALGTSYGNIYLGSIREEPNGKPKVSFGKLDNINKEGTNAVTSIEFSAFDPFGSILVTFDNGVVKTWQSSVRNEQFMKLIEIQQQQQNAGQEISTPLFDFSEAGYQQFDLIDSFDMFENPHGQDELTEDDRAQLKLLYSNKKYKHCGAKFSPGKTSVDIYFSFVTSLQYVYVRNYIQRAIVKRVSLLHFPTCFSLLDYNSLFISDDEPTHLGGEQVLLFTGTKEGKVLIHKVSSSQSQKLVETKAGISYGGITAIDVSSSQDKIIVGNESGELFTIDILTNIEGANQ